MSLVDIINNAKDGEVYKATYAMWNNWYITKSAGFIRYCSCTGDAYDTIMLTPSNLRAEYELVLP